MRFFWMVWPWDLRSKYGANFQPTLRKTYHFSKDNRLAPNINNTFTVINFKTDKKFINRIAVISKRLIEFEDIFQSFNSFEI